MSFRVFIDLYHKKIVVEEKPTNWEEKQVKIFVSNEEKIISTNAKF